MLPAQMIASGALGAHLGPIDPATYRLGNPGRNPKCRYQHFFGFDVSWSVLGYNDTAGRGFEEIWQAINVVARSSNANTTVGLLPFDLPSVGMVQPGPLNDPAHLRRLRANLRVPPDAAGISELDPALTRAEQLAAASDAVTTFTVVTDFALFDPPEARIYDRLATFPGPVFAVVLGQPAPPELTGDNVSVIEIGAQDAPGTLATAIWNSLTTGRSGRRQGSITLDVKPAVEVA